MHKTIRILTLVAAMIVGAGETWADNVKYLDASGTSKTCATATKINSSTSEVQLGADGTTTWYYVEGTVNISNVIKVSGDVHLILCDNAKLNVTIVDNVDWNAHGYTPAIYGDYNSSLTIYGQSTGEDMGSLTTYVNNEINVACFSVFSWAGLTINGGKVTTNGRIEVRSFTINGGELTVSKAGWGIYISEYIPEEDPNYNRLTINGGKVTAILTAENGPININGGQVIAEAVGDYPAIYTKHGSVYIRGGQVTATSTGGKGIVAENSETSVEIVLSWKEPTDFITASSYYVESDGFTAVVKTEHPKRFVAYNAPTGTAASAIFSGDYDNSGIVSDADLEAIAGKTLRPLNGYCVSTTDPNIILTAGSTAKTPDFTITTGEGAGAVTTLYYICSENDVMTLSMPDGCVTSGYTVKKDGTDVTNTVLSSSTLTMPDYDITVEATKTDLWGIGAGAKGTQDHPYTITTTDGLDLLAKMVNGTDGYAANYFSGKYFVLGNDITYTHKQAGETGADTENNYTAIGGWNSNFQGTFDGQGHTVSGIRIYKDGSGREDKYLGLFGNILGGTVCHVTLDDAQITGYEGTGGIVGINNRGNITDCHVTENVCISAQQNTSYHGGIVGSNDGSVSGCTSKAKIKTNSSSCYKFGGIAGCNDYNGTMKDCLYLGSEVEGYSYVGAVAGVNYGSIINCYYTNVLFFGKGAGGSPISGNNAIGINYGYGTVTNTGLARTITLGEGVTLNGTATSYGPASPNTSDVRITSYATAADQPGFVLKLETVSGTTTTTATTTYYSTSGATVALGYSGTLPTGCSVDYVVTAAGSNVAVSEANTFVTPDDNVTVSTKLYMKNVPYMTWNDTQKKLVDATTPDDTKVYLLTGGGATTLPGGWYVVMNTNTDATVDEGIDAHYTGTLTFNGDASIILADGAEMTVTNTDDDAIYGNNASLAIYAQSTAAETMGSLTANGNITANSILAPGVTVNAENITVNGDVTAGSVKANNLTATNHTLTLTGTGSNIDRANLGEGTLTVNANAGGNVGNLTAKTVNVNQGGGLTVSSLMNLNNLSVTGGTLTLGQASDLSGAAITLASDGVIKTTAGNLTVGDISGAGTIQGKNNVILLLTIDNADLNIVAESGNIDATANSVTSINVKSLTAPNGNINAAGKDITAETISASRVTARNIKAGSGGNITINGGQVTAESISASNGDIILGWKNLDDFIHANSYSGTVKIAEGQYFTYEGNTGSLFSGTLSAGQVSAIAGQALIPFNGLPTNGGQYMLLYMEDACYKITTGGVKTYVVSGYDLSGTGTVGITEMTDGGDGGVPKAIPVIIGVESGTLPSSIELEKASADEATAIQNNATAAKPLENLFVCDGSSSVGDLLAAALGGTADLSDYVLFTFVNGSFRPVIATAESKPDKGTCLLAIPKVDILTKGSSGSSNGARTQTIPIDLGGETGVRRPSPGPSLYGGEWYDLQGRRLSGAPTRKGVYINGSRAVVVK